MQTSTFWGAKVDSLRTNSHTLKSLPYLLKMIVDSIGSLIFSFPMNLLGKLSLQQCIQLSTGKLKNEENI